MSNNNIDAALKEIVARFSFNASLATFKLLNNGEFETTFYGDTKTVFPWKSVTKLATARTVLCSVENGILTLDDVLYDEIVINGKLLELQGITVRNLLAHASGIEFSQYHQSVKPEKKRIYSNAGYEVVTRVLADRSGIPFKSWLAAMVQEPLHMLSSFVGSPAYGMSSNIENLALFGQELLLGAFISSALNEEFFTPQFARLDGILPGYGMQKPNSWGLGAEIRSNKHPHWTSKTCPPWVAGHFGSSGSFLWIDRKRKCGAAFLGDKPFSDEHKCVWPMINGILGA